jgi:nucleotide-binding universal stress UspA family protein
MNEASDVDPSAPVVVGCDGSDGSEFTIGFGIQEARRRQTSLLILTAFERPIDPDIDSFDVPEDQLKRRAQSRAEAFLALAVAQVGPAPADTRVIAFDGRAAHALVNMGTDVSVIVVGSHQGGFMSRAIYGSTGRDIIKHAQVPVIILPQVT